MPGSVPPDWRYRAELRPATVAAVSGRSLRTVHRLIASGALPSRRVGRCRLVPVSAVLEFVGESTPAGTSAASGGDPRPGGVGPSPASDRALRTRARELYRDMRRQVG